MLGMHMRKNSYYNSVTGDCCHTLKRNLSHPKGWFPWWQLYKSTSKKVWLVHDYWELNGFVEAFIANAEVYMQKLRKWQWQGVDVLLLDQWNAYLQMHIDKVLWPFQSVIFKGKRFCFSQLGFGLNVTPLIIKSVINAITSQDQIIKSATSTYINNIFINKSLDSAVYVQQHFLDYSLVHKNLEQLKNGTGILGRQVWGENCTLQWKRGGQVSEIPNMVTHQCICSFCGKLVDHFCVCGWLRVATTFIKRSDEEMGWWGQRCLSDASWWKQ